MCINKLLHFDLQQTDRSYGEAEGEQKDIVVAAASIKTNEKEVLKVRQNNKCCLFSIIYPTLLISLILFIQVDDKVRPQMSVRPTGSGLASPVSPVPSLTGPVSPEDGGEAQDAVTEDAASTGHSLIVKSTDAKNKVSLVVKPIESHTEKPHDTTENNESSSRHMDHGARLRHSQTNDALSKLVNDTIAEKRSEQGPNMYLTEDEINRLPVDLGSQKPPTNDNGLATMNPDLPLPSAGLPQDIESLMTSVLGPDAPSSQRAEHEIEKIKNSLAAEFETPQQKQQQPVWQPHQSHQPHQPHPAHLAHQTHQPHQPHQPPPSPQASNPGHGNPQLGLHAHYNPAMPQQQQPNNNQASWAGSQQYQGRPSPQQFPNASFSSQPPPQRHSLPPMVGQPQIPPRPHVPMMAGAQDFSPAYRAPSIDSGMGSSTPSTPSSTPTTTAAATIQLPGVEEAKEPGVWDLFEKEINAFTADAEDKEKQGNKPPGLQILKPDQLNERHTPGKDSPQTSRPEGAQRLQQFTMATPGGGSRTVIVQKMLPGMSMPGPSPTKTITVANPMGGPAPPGSIRLQSPAALGLPVAGANTVTGAPRVVVGGAPGQYLYPLGNRLQPATVSSSMIRLAAPGSSPLASTAPMPVAGTSGLGVRLANPANLINPTLINPALQSNQMNVANAMMVNGQPHLTSPPHAMQPGMQVPLPGSPMQQRPPGPPTGPPTPGSPMRGRGGPRPRGMARGRGAPPGARPGGPRGPRPGGPMRPMRPGAPGMRGMRPRGIGPRGMRPGGPRGPRPGGPRGPRPPGMGMRPGGPPRPPAPPPPEQNEIKCTKDTTREHVKREAPEMIDLSDDDSPPPPPRSATLDKLSHLGISVSRQKAPQIPKNVQARLPPGISLSHTGSPGASKRPAASSNASFTMTPAADEPAPKRVAVPENVAGALAGLGGSSGGATKKVELELSDAQINALRALGMM